MIVKPPQPVQFPSEFKHAHMAAKKSYWNELIFNAPVFPEFPLTMIANTSTANIQIVNIKAEWYYHDVDNKWYPATRWYGEIFGLKNGQILHTHRVDRLSVFWEYDCPISPYKQGHWGLKP